MTEEKTIYNLKLHETLEVSKEVELLIDGGVTTKSIKKFDVTRVPGGWVYAFDYPGWRQSQTVFVPFNNDFQLNKK